MAATTVPAFDGTYGVAEANLCNIALARIGVEPILDTVEDSEPARACRRQYARTRDELLRDYDFNFSIQAENFNENTTYLQKEKWSYVFDPPPVLSILRVIRVDNDADAEFELRDAHLFANRYSTSGYSITATTSNGTVNLTGISASDIGLLKVGHLITGTGISAGTTIATIGTNSATISQNATASGTVTLSSPKKLQARYVLQVINPALFDPVFYDALALRLASKMALALTGKVELEQASQSEFAAIINQANIASSKEKFDEEGETLWTERSFV
jgi:hypothetical protein